MPSCDGLINLLWAYRKCQRYGATVRLGVHPLEQPRGRLAEDYYAPRVAAPPSRSGGAWDHYMVGTEVRTPGGAAQEGIAL